MMYFSEEGGDVVEFGVGGEFGIGWFVEEGVCAGHDALD
jgi:hypothetical protein